MKHESEILNYLRKPSLKKMFFLLTFCFISVLCANAQIKISGKVTDTGNEPMIGISVKVKNSSKGTVTDLDGKYTIEVPDAKSVLVFSFISYKTKEIPVGNRSTIDVVMEENVELLDEIVVIGFQSQRKENLTASVASVSAEALENRPVANIGQALQGVVPGLNIDIKGGDPNKVPSLNIRGATTIRQRGTSNDDKQKFDIVSGSPLILLDGVEISSEDLNQLNPNDIDNISFLKDASAAAIYGTRATFGVILVQSRSGSFNQKSKISYSYDLSYDRPFRLPDILDSYTIYKSGLDYKLWTGAISKYTEKDELMLQHMKAYIEDPVHNKPYHMDGDAIQWNGNTNPYKELLRSWTPTQKHNFSVSGGSEKLSYYISLGTQDQEGMYEIRTDKLRRYNMMMNITAKVTDWLKIDAKASYNIFNYNTPTQREAGSNIWLYAKSTFPENWIYQPVLTASDDPLPNFETENPVSYLYRGGTSKTSRRKSIYSISPEITIIPKELKLKADFSLTPTTYSKEETHPLQKRVNTSWKALESRWATQNTGTVTRTNTDQYAINIYADYNKTFKQAHNFSALLGVNQERESYAGSELSLVAMLDPHILNPKLVEDVTANTSTNSHHIVTSRAIFGRLMYNYMSRYLLEVDGRYDGSSRFPKNDRFQFFPTLSLGWRVSEEAFMKWSREWLENLKLRASWGRLGSQPSEKYPYQSVFDTEEAYFLFDGTRYPTGVTVPSLRNPNLKWERSTTKNFGVDIAAFGNRLSFTGDIYERRVTDILIPGGKDYPALIGSDELPHENAGELKSTGFELSLKWADRLANGLNYSVGFSLSDSKGKVLSYPSNTTSQIGDGKLYKGAKLGEIWGYETGGILQEGDFSGVGSNGKPLYKGATFKSEQVYPGFLWYKDLNNDGIISGGLNTVGDPGDRKIIGNNTPRYRYNIMANLQYKGFDLDLMFQGVAKRDYWLSSSTSYWGNGAGSWHTYNQSWTPENINARFPMYRSTFGGRTQTAYLLDASYFKLKQVVLGYTLPKHIVERIKLSKVRFNLSAYNLFTITDIPKYYDSEYISDAYPPKQTFAFGVQVTY